MTESQDKTEGKQTSKAREKSASTRLSGPRVALAAKEQLTQLTGLRPDTVSELTREEEGWRVRVEMVELERIPAATDVLATYEVHLDAEGTLMEYERIRRYRRDQVSDG